jgi:quercetin dioxygenase-like cupin family protein
MNTSVWTPVMFVLVVLAGPAWAVRVVQEEVNQTRRTPQFENDEVRVWKSVVAPGSPLPPHRHDHPRVIVTLIGGTMVIAEQGGASETHQWESGRSYWLPANPAGALHTDVNTGAKPIEVMVVELKKSR